MGEIVAIGGASGDSGRILYNNNNGNNDNDNYNNENEISFILLPLDKTDILLGWAPDTFFLNTFLIVSISKSNTGC